jgi:hypothetical protein
MQRNHHRISAHEDRQAINDTIDGYSTLIAQRVADGWKPFLLSLLFDKIAGKPDAAVATMLREAEYLYSAFLTRAVRRPLAPRSIGHLPILIAAPDLPVGKANKPIADVVINDGAHVHGVLAMPPRSRLPVPADEHFRQHQALYVGGRSRLRQVDVRPIEGPVDRVVDYALKSLQRRRFSRDQVLVLPRARSELIK